MSAAGTSSYIQISGKMFQNKVAEQEVEELDGQKVQLEVQTNL